MTTAGSVQPPVITWRESLGTLSQTVGALLAAYASFGYLYAVVALSLADVGTVADGPQRIADTAGRQAGTTGLLMLSVVCAAAALLGVAPLRWFTPSVFRPRSPRSVLELTGWALVVLPVANVVAYPLVVWVSRGWSWARLAAESGPPVIASWGDVYVVVGTAVAAGVGEEVCALAVPLWLAALGARMLRVQPKVRAAGLWAVGGALVVVRMAYHLYQGPTSLTHLPWAVATVVIFCTTRRVLPLIVCHVLTDLVGLTAQTFISSSTAALVASELTPLVVLGGVLVVLGRRRRAHTSAPTTATA